MNRAEALQALTDLVLKSKPSAEVTEDSSLNEDFGFDSLDTINFFFELENVTGCHIEEKDIDAHELSSVKNILDFIENKS